MRINGEIIEQAIIGSIYGALTGPDIKAGLDQIAETSRARSEPIPTYVSIARHIHKFRAQTVSVVEGGARLISNIFDAIDPSGNPSAITEMARKKFGLDTYSFAKDKALRDAQRTEALKRNF